MRFHPGVAILVGYLQVQAQAQTHGLFSERAEATAALVPPDCALPCLATLVPEFCGSLMNTTCVCTNKELTTALAPCALAACNITEALSLQKYSAEGCGATNDKSRQDEQYRVYYVFPAVVFCFLAARIYSRVALEVGMGPDDWMMVAAFCAYITDCGTGLTIVAHGFGQHTYYLTVHQVSQALKFFYICELLYLLAITLTKLSLLLFFRRIFPNSNFRIWIWIVFGFVVASNFALTMALTFQCVPFHGNWTNWMYKVPPVKCIDSYAAIYTAAGMSILHNLIILLMPIPILWKLNLAWQKKAHLVVMFSVGSFVIICSLLRLPSLLVLKSSSDPSYDQAPIAVWTHFETAIGIICGCLPACRSLIGHLFPAFKMTLGPSNGGTPGYPPQSRSRSNNNKLDKQRDGTSTRSFIELHDRMGSQDELERGSNGKTDGDGDRASITSMGSEIPITDKLVPSGGKGCGFRTTVNVSKLDEGSTEKVGREDRIVMTRTVEQSRQRL